jgi:hypothetical protein
MKITPNTASGQHNKIFLNSNKTTIHENFHKQKVLKANDRKRIRLFNQRKKRPTR